MTPNTVRIAALLGALAAAVPAAAADTTKVYTSGVLVLAFVAFCALVVVAQITPVAMLLVGMARGVARLFTGNRAEAVQEKN